jgi:hypothetical protein
VEGLPYILVNGQIYMHDVITLILEKCDEELVKIINESQRINYGLDMILFGSFIYTHTDKYDSITEFNNGPLKWIRDRLTIENEKGNDEKFGNKYCVKIATTPIQKLINERYTIPKIKQLLE